MPKLTISNTVFEPDPYSYKGGRFAAVDFKTYIVMDLEEATAVLTEHLAKYSTVVHQARVMEKWKEITEKGGEIHFITDGSAFDSSEAGIRYSYDGRE